MEAAEKPKIQVDHPETLNQAAALARKPQSLAVVATRPTVHEIRECVAKMAMLASNGKEVAHELGDHDAESTFRMVLFSCRVASTELDALQGLPRIPERSLAV